VSKLEAAWRIQARLYACPDAAIMGDAIAQAKSCFHALSEKLQDNKCDQDAEQTGNEFRETVNSTCAGRRAVVHQ
jgi:hypothetical protein